MSSEANSGYETWETGAYTDLYPYVYFSVKKDSSEQTFTISTFGTDGISLTGYSSASDGVLFDDGEIEITAIDTVNNIISGKIWATTTNGSSFLNGNFEVDIEH